MSATWSEIGTGIKAKLQLLIGAYERMKLENTRLLRANEELSAELSRKDALIVELQERCSRLNLAQALTEPSADTRDAKLKVSKIVREIDKCIALLNR